MIRLHSLTLLLIPCLLLAPATSRAQEALSAVTTLTLASTDTISREVATGKILALAGQHFDGEIALIWNNDGFNTSAQNLRSALIAQGVAPDRITLTHEAGGFSNRNDGGIRIVIQRLRPRLSECTDKQQNYRFNDRTEQGCALNNSRSRALVTPYHYD